MSKMYLVYPYKSGITLLFFLFFFVVVFLCGGGPCKNSAEPDQMPQDKASG